MHIILLAAGLSRRMGEANKLLLPYGNKTILETTVENIIAANIGDIVVVIGHEPEKVRAVLEKYPDILIVENKNYAQGMTSSIQAGVKSAMSCEPLAVSQKFLALSCEPLAVSQKLKAQSSKLKAISPKLKAQSSTAFMICLSDMPLIQPNTYKLIADFFCDNLKCDEKTIAQPQFNNITGNPIIFSNFYKKEILEHTAPEGCRDIVQKHKAHLKKIEMPTDSILRDIDNQQEYNKLTTDNGRRTTDNK